MWAQWADLDGKPKGGRLQALGSLDSSADKGLRATGGGENLAVPLTEFNVYSFHTFVRKWK